MKTIAKIAFLAIILLFTINTHLPAQELAKSYQEVAQRIIKAGRKGNDSYLKLQELCDDIGHRLSGSPSLDKAIEWAQASMKKDGQENVRAERVTIRKWVRGNESCELVDPRPMKIHMLGLGWSIGTPKEGVTAETIVVDSKEELDALSDDQIKGKIVVFNAAMPTYSEAEGSGYGGTVRYRGSGAKWAAERGAVAALVRSVTAYSLVSPHTGAMRYDAEIKKIPTAAISVEAAEMLKRFQLRGKKCTVKLYMEAEDQGRSALGKRRRRDRWIGEAGRNRLDRRPHRFLGCRAGRSGRWSRLRGGDGGPQHFAKTEASSQTNYPRCPLDK